MAAKQIDEVRIELPSAGPCPIRFCILGAWDDLSGPAVRFLFTFERDHGVTDEQARDLTKIGLSFHLNDPNKLNYFTICEFCDMNLSAFNCIYSATTNSRSCMYCFFCVFPRSYYSILKSMTSTFSSFWEEKMDMLRVFHQLKSFSETDVAQLYSTSFIPSFCDFFAQFERNRSVIQHLPLKSYFQAICFQDKFLQRCIASHLITFGRSLVIGTERDMEVINRMIYVLRLFSLPLQRTLCVFLSSDNLQRRYHAELMIQGLVVQPDEGQRYPIDVWDLLKSAYPLTLINVPRRKVKQSVPLLMHQAKRRTFLGASIATFLKASADGTPLRPNELFSCVKEVKVKGLFADGNVLSLEVDDLCCELQTFNGAADLIVNYINLFMRQMVYKAKTLIAYVNDLTSKATSSVSVSSKNLWTVLNVSVDADFLILLAFAEQLQPGIISALERVC